MYQLPSLYNGSVCSPILNIWATSNNSIILKDIISYFKTKSGYNFRVSDKILLVDCSRIVFTSKENLFIEQILFLALNEVEKKLSKREYDIFKNIYEKYKLQYHREYERDNQFYIFFEELNTLKFKIFLLFQNFEYFSNRIEQSDFKKLHIISQSDSKIHFWLHSTQSIDQIVKKDTYDSLFYSALNVFNIEQNYSQFEFERFYDILQTECSFASTYRSESVNHKQLKELIYSNISTSPIALDNFKYHLLSLIRDFVGIYYEEAINRIIFNKNLNMKKQEIYISYAWGDNHEENESRESIVNLIDKTFTEKGFILTRDKKDLGYKGNISEFEERIGKGNYIILILSDKFLKSHHCMNELLQIRNNGNIYNRIFPIVLKDALIYKEIERIDYINYWDDESKKLQTKIDTIKNSVGTVGVVKTLNLYSDIRRFFDEITALLKNMNTLTPEMHKESNFSQLIEAIEKQNEEDIQNQEITSNGVISKRTVNQYGSKSLYIEKNNGNITIN